jgi:hypothetical protein
MECTVIGLGEIHTGLSSTDLPSTYIHSTCFCPHKKLTLVFWLSFPLLSVFLFTVTEGGSEGSTMYVGRASRRSTENPTVSVHYPPGQSEIETLVCDYLYFTKYTLCEGSKENTKICPCPRCFMRFEAEILILLPKC